MRVLKNHLVVEKFIVEDYLGKLTGPFKETTHKSRDIIAIPHTLSNVRSLKRGRGPRPESCYDSVRVAWAFDPERLSRWTQLI